eukprot:CAMPEP_0172685552 /NCGR_PEP_ID=MMETSP1074-20121228/20323_1 /TAXON_ID=2916 /ORGANISM="Ceratium fusus, Strain PA161109" /LENGTH=163 /DNA_ID=CAMNT_0013504717 /DNA_START=91 /DNA_END=582 /DNA_ORIENTATION=-
MTGQFISARPVLGSKREAFVKRARYSFTASKVASRTCSGGQQTRPNMNQGASTLRVQGHEGGKHAMCAKSSAIRLEVIQEHDDGASAACSLSFQPEGQGCTTAKAPASSTEDVRAVVEEKESTPKSADCVRMETSGGQCALSWRWSRAESVRASGCEELTSDA